MPRRPSRFESEGDRLVNMVRVFDCVDLATAILGHVFGVEHITRARQGASKPSGARYEDARQLSARRRGKSEQRKGRGNKPAGRSESLLNRATVEMTGAPVSRQTGTWRASGREASDGETPRVGKAGPDSQFFESYQTCADSRAIKSQGRQPGQRNCWRMDASSSKSV